MLGGAALALASIPHSSSLFLLWRDLMCRDCLLFPLLTA